MDWTKLADEKTLNATAEALRKRGFEVTIVDNGAAAKKRVLEMIPKKAEVLNVSSTTLNEIGVMKEIDESNEYDLLNKRIRAIKDEKERNEFRKKTLSPDYVIGSVHAITEDGQVVVATASGSQIPPYSYGATNVILVVGTQKITKNLDDALKRVYEHSLALETERMKKAYGISSSVNQILLIEATRQGRIKIILVKERLGF